MKAIQFLKRELQEFAALKYTPWYRWHPNIALRYLPVVERIKEEGRGSLKRSDPGVRQGQTLRILEVGSGGLGITPYLKQPVTGVDISFDPPIHPLLKRVKGDATDLKFGDNSFDVVISIDMLEHLPKERRQKAVGEMMRVGKRLVIIGVPCGKEAEKHDRNIFIASARSLDYARDDGDRGFEFLDEQVEYGLPDEADILQHIKVAAKDLRKEIEIETRGNMYLRLRSFLMWGWMSKNLLVNILFRKVFLLLIPLFRFFDRPPYYRQIFFIQILKGPTLPYGKVGP